MVVWAYQVKFKDGSFETRTINVKAGVKGETFQEEQQRVMSRIKSRYRSKGKEVEIVNLGVRG